MNLNDPAFDTLTPEQESELHDTLYDSNREEWKNKLILANVRFAKAFVGKYFSKSESDEDLFQTALLGLSIAAESFDPKRGVRFNSYVGRIILSQLRKFVPHISSYVSSELKMNMRTMVVLDTPLCNHAGLKDGATYKDLITSAPEFPGWRCVDPASVSNAKEEAEEYDEVVSMIEEELRQCTNADIKKIGKNINTTVSKDDVVEIFRMRYVEDKLFSEIGKIKKRCRSYISNVCKIIEALLNQKMWSKSKYNDPDWKRWREIYASQNKIDDINCFLGVDVELKDVVKKHTKRAQCRCNFSWERDKENKNARKCQAFSSGEVAVSRGVCSLYRKLYTGGTRYLGRTRASYSGSGFYSRVHRHPNLIRNRRIVEYYCPFRKPSFIKPIYTIGLPLGCRSCLFSPACSSWGVNLKHDNVCSARKEMDR